ncbi:uncharacterized protein LAESUDRAFT_765509 [Laetiporus sulphureus 93-53]|uniref:Uncharacterized protein n=1 Tax=Laetiporus sulphureus 93-53 TaxID=1314785 RepID=A0A165AQM4_9APHY|nr:uncharacterized protein LAESUDRAFT_765509 [Laetiporus sulphureus 93-53]KZS99462.1 hypothetical protein LAESUDRAFT_765509 [Laetiporus sulphureus 93-53]
MSIRTFQRIKIAVDIRHIALDATHQTRECDGHSRPRTSIPHAKRDMLPRPTPPSAAAHDRPLRDAIARSLEPSRADDNPAQVLAKETA